MNNLAALHLTLGVALPAQASEPARPAMTFFVTSAGPGSGGDLAVEIERELATALAAARALGTRLLEPAICLERAALAEARGEIAERRSHLQTAHALWTEMGSERNAARVEKLLSSAT